MVYYSTGEKIISITTLLLVLGLILGLGYSLIIGCCTEEVEHSPVHWVFQGEHELRKMKTRVTETPGNISGFYFLFFGGSDCSTKI